jgi:hypothetical protein
MRKFAKIALTVCFVATAASAALLSVGPAACVAQQFRPIDQLSSWYTDRSLVDLEITATKGQGDERVPVKPAQVLRLRLERAYVEFLVHRESPPSNIVLISFDSPSGLPSALFKALPEQLEARGDPIHKLTRQEWASRTINVSLEGGNLADRVKAVSAELQYCKGAELQTDLFAFEPGKDGPCFRRSIGFGKRYVAKFSDEILLLLRCSSALLGCEVSIPFEGLLATVSFNERHLSDWRNIAETATVFLQSKRFR